MDFLGTASTLDRDAGSRAVILNKDLRSCPASSPRLHYRQRALEARCCRTAIATDQSRKIVLSSRTTLRSRRGR
jgi:hypothetical protein